MSRRNGRILDQAVSTIFATKIKRIQARLFHNLPAAIRPFWSRWIQRPLGLRLTDCGNGNCVDIAFGATRRLSVTFLGNNNRVIIKSDASVCDVQIHILGNDSLIEISEDCRIDRALFWMTESSSEIRIGLGTFLQESRIFLTDRRCSVRIGQRCMIANGSELRCGDGHAIFSLNDGEILNRAHFILLEDNVWLASRVFVLKDVTVGTGSIVGAGSVITKSIPPYTLAAGVPARALRSGVTWREENIDRLPSGWFESGRHDSQAVSTDRRCPEPKA